MYTLEALNKTYPGRHGTVQALQEVSFTIKKGSFVTVTGPSGSGKSTLLLTLGGLIRPTSGRIMFHDTDLGRLDEPALAAYRNRSIGFVLQSFNLIPFLTALENVMVPVSLGGVASPDSWQRAEELLKRIGLGDRLDHLPRELSVGQQQRVAIARALINDPEVILADEPTGNLDPGLAAEILGILQDLNTREKRTVVMVTHSPEAACLGTDRIHLALGRCRAA